MKKLKSILALLLALVMVLSLAACGGNSAEDTKAPAADDTKAPAVEDDTTAAPADDTTASGLDWLNLGSVMPIVKEGVEKTLSLCLPIDDAVIDTYKERFTYRFITESLNINLDVQAVPSSAWGEKRPLILADTDNLPDLIISGGFGTGDLVRYGAEEGLFVDLAPYITDAYMPNLASFFGDYPEYKANWVDADGHIYSAGKLTYSSMPDTTQWHYLNYTWLDDVGAELPTTLDEFTDLMRLFKEKKSAEFGEEIYPISGKFTGWNSICRYLLAACGFVGTNKSDGFPGGDINMRNGKVTLPCADREGWEGFVKTLKLWYDEGLIHPEFITGDSQAIDALISAGKTGFVTVPPFIWVGDNCREWWGAPLLTSEWCEKPGVCSSAANNSIGVVVVTTACEELELALAFVDFWYNRGSKASEQYCQIVSWGVFEGSELAELYPDDVHAKEAGVGYEHLGVKENGYVDANEMLKNEITLWGHGAFGNFVIEDENGPTATGTDWLLENFKKYDGTGEASREILKSQAFIDFPNYDVQNTSPRAFNFNYMVDADEEFPALVYFDAETQERVNDIRVALSEYAMSETAKFIVGERDLAELPDYFDQMDALGAQEYIQIHQDYFDAVKGN